MSVVFFFFSYLALALSYPFDISYHIDCGASTNFTDRFNITWLSDRFFTGGAAGLVSEPLRFSNIQEKTLRYFSSGKKNCYILPLPNGRYFLRIFTVYDNFDGRSHPPSFDVAVEGTLVFSYRSPWPNDASRSGAYSDLFAFVKDGEADVCFYSIATDAPVIGALEAVQVDTLSYDSNRTGDNHLLVNYGRLSCGGAHWGPGFSNDTDLFGRSWQSDSGFRSRSSYGVREIFTMKQINGTDREPDYFPERLYQHAAVGEVEYELEVDAKLDYLVWLHFAEIDVSVTEAGQRVFDVIINGKNVSRIDVVREVGTFAAYSTNYTLMNLTTTILTVKLVPVSGVPLICGLENYAVVPADILTLPDQVIAMRALKDSLHIPERMGWNGDPCAPTTWDAWEGITCRPNQNGSALVISQIDLGSQGLKGYISDRIGLLSNLVFLNLSSNSIEGVLPEGLGEKMLVRLDLSNNKFVGTIPYSLTSSSLQLVLLNNNLLEGRVPEELYSVGVRGGIIDLSGNKGLCGVPSLPSCPAFWQSERLSHGGKIGIVVSSVGFVFIIFVLAYVCYIRRRNSDYDFDLPKDLMSLSAKRNRYKRQKSLMLLELESQHAKGIPTTLHAP